MSIHSVKPEHEIAYKEISALLERHSAKLSALEVLAIASNMVGKLVALQDQRIMTPNQALEVVMQNIEMGNREAIAELQSMTAKSSH